MARAPARAHPASVYAIRLAIEADLARVNEIERRAAGIFRDIGLDEIAELPPMPMSELYRACHDERLYVATAENDEPIGFAMVSLIDGELHLEELDVDPAHQRRGIGRALIEHACSIGRARGMASMTLHTFREIPWNEPFYASAGCVAIERHAMGPELTEKTILDAARFGPRRVCMRRLL